MGWEVDEEVNRDKTGEADGMNLEVDSKDEVMSDLWLPIAKAAARLFCRFHDDRCTRFPEILLTKKHMLPKKTIVVKSVFYVFFYKTCFYMF